MFPAYSNPGTSFLESFKSGFLKVHRKDFLFFFQELLQMIFVNFDNKQKLTS